jgi:hypothetical protein
MGSQQCGNAGKSQSVHTMVDPIIVTGPHIEAPWLVNGGHGASLRRHTGLAACGAGAAAGRGVARRARVAAAVTGLLVGAATVVFVSWAGLGMADAHGPRCSRLTEATRPRKEEAEHRNRKQKTDEETHTPGVGVGVLDHERAAAVRGARHRRRLPRLSRTAVWFRRRGCRQPLTAAADRRARRLNALPKPSHSPRERTHRCRSARSQRRHRLPNLNLSLNHRWRTQSERASFVSLAGRPWQRGTHKNGRRDRCGCVGGGVIEAPWEFIEAPWEFKPMALAGDRRARRLNEHAFLAHLCSPGRRCRRMCRRCSRSCFGNACVSVFRATSMPTTQARPVPQKTQQPTTTTHAPGGGVASVAAAGVLDHERPAAVLDAAVPSRCGMVAGVAVAAAEDALAVPTNHTRAASNGRSKFHCARAGAAEWGGKRESELLVFYHGSGGGGGGGGGSGSGDCDRPGGGSSSSRARASSARIGCIEAPRQAAKCLGGLRRLGGISSHGRTSITSTSSEHACASKGATRAPPTPHLQRTPCAARAWRCRHGGRTTKRRAMRAVGEVVRPRPSSAVGGMAGALGLAALS